MVKKIRFNIAFTSEEIQFNMPSISYTRRRTGGKQFVLPRTNDNGGGRAKIFRRLPGSQQRQGAPGLVDQFGHVVLPDAGGAVLRQHVLGIIPPHVAHVDGEDVAVLVQTLHVLVSVRGIARHVDAVRALVTRLLAVARAHHVSLEMHLRRVTIRTVQALIRSYVPGTVGVPPLIS